MITGPLKLVIIDDHPIIGHALSERLALFPVDVIGNLHKLEELCTLPVEPKAVDMWIIDLELGTSNSWALIKELRKLPVPPAIVVYTMHGSPWTKERLRSLGVEYMVDKSDPIEEFDNAIRAFFCGEPYASASFRDCGEFEGLTARETEVLSLMAKGLTTTAIAERLIVSESTVQTYRKSLMEKFGVHNVAELITKARGLV